MKFEQYPLQQTIRQSLEEMGFKRPTDIQFKAIPSILKGEDVLAIAQTGTGKTAAFAIPIIQLLSNQRGSYRGIQALVMAPTRELVAQIHEVFLSIGKHTDLHMVALLGGVSQNEQIDELGAEPDLVVATPGRLFDLLHQRQLDINSVRILVLDESDKMMALGFMKDVEDIKKRLPRNHQTLFFSATINEIIKKQAYSLVRNAIRIQISPKNMVSKNVDHSVVMVSMDEKRFFLERILRQHPEARILVFVRTRVRAERLFSAMQRVGIITVTIHGEKDQSERFAALDAFTQSKVQILITTDVSARGIDIKKIEFVVNYDMPDIPENYVHRVGRTGRGVEKGFAISFCSPEETPLLLAIETFVGAPLTRLELAADDHQATLDFSAEVKPSVQLIMKEIAENEAFLKTKKKKKQS